MSANVYRKCETGFQKPSRRDDCISILFVLAYLRNVGHENKTGFHGRTSWIVRRLNSSMRWTVQARIPSVVARSKLNF